MLRTQTVEKGTLDLIKKLMSDDKFNDFNLVGGTALALLIGHRISIDIDLFSSGPFEALELKRYLIDCYQAEEVNIIKNGVFCFINIIKVDLVAHQFPFVGEVSNEEGIRMVSLLDIGAMKLNAIHNSGSRLKDFIDVSALLDIFSLDQLLDACHQKYPDLNIRVVRHALLYFNDINFGMPVHPIGRPIQWSEIAHRLKKANLNPDQKLSPIDRLKDSVNINKRGKGRKL